MRKARFYTQDKMFLEHNGTEVEVGEEYEDFEKEPGTGRMWHVTFPNGDSGYAFEKELFYYEPSGDYKVIEANYEETGGGVLTYWGKLANGQYFAFGLSDIIILDEDYGVVFTEEFFEETGGDTYEWENEHMINQFEFPLSEGDPKYPAYIVIGTIDILKAKYGKSEIYHGFWDERCSAEIL